MIQEEREQKLLDLFNAAIELMGPVEYATFNAKYQVSDGQRLLDLEAKFPELCLAQKIDDHGYAPDNVCLTTLSLIATITDVLAGKRLAFITEENPDGSLGKITGVTWWRWVTEDTANAG